ncbi:MAG: 50S ribosome-binding GTPase [Alphaproteobacteria bacterium]|nr:50S ribosome-binding GTPase [Alphaproteobacteria bacterium]
MSELVALLDRCHRDELVPLARLLSLRTDGVGLADLARGIDGRLRREGGQAVANLVRGGGPGYREVLEDVARHLELEPLEAEGDAQLEGRVVGEWLRRAWDSLPPDQREGLWVMFTSGEDTPDGHAATARARLALGEQWTFRSTALAAFTVTGAGLLALLARPFIPFLVAGGLLKAMGPRLSVTLPAVVQIAMLRQQVRHRVTVGFVGSPSSGKDAAIRAIFGIDSGNIHPVAGSTREVSVTQVPDSLALFVVNTPGMGDVVEAVTEEARQVLNHIDIYVYVLNAEGGVQARELADYGRCVASNKPTLVLLNKIDVLRPGDVDRYVADARTKLSKVGIPEDAVQLLPAAVDPLPQISESPLGVEAVHAWLAAQLSALGKDPGELPPLPAADDSGAVMRPFQ